MFTFAASQKIIVLDPVTDRVQPAYWTTKDERLRAFAVEYVKDFDGKRAALAVGVPEGSARVQAHHWLQTKVVRDTLSEMYEKRRDESEVTVTRVLEELRRIAFASMRSYVSVNDEGDVAIDLTDLSEEEWAAVSAVETMTWVEEREDGAPIRHTTVKFKLWDKPRALELLGKHLKMFRDIIDIPGVERLADELKAARQRAAIDVEVLNEKKGLTQ